MHTDLSLQADAHNLDVLSFAPRYNASLISEFLDAWMAHGAGALNEVLDFGAGIGTLTQLLGEQVPRVTALEPLPAYHAALSSRCSRVVSSLDEVHSPVDAIFTSNVLEHIEDDQSILNAFFDKLRPGGLLFIYVPALPCLFSEMDRAVGHVRRYERDELSIKVRGAGFDIQQVGFRDCIGVPASLWLKMQGARGAHPSPSAVSFYDRWIFPMSRMLDKLGIESVMGKNLQLVATRGAGEWKQ